MWFSILNISGGSRFNQAKIIWQIFIFTLVSLSDLKVNLCIADTVNDTQNDTQNDTVNELELSKSEQLILNIISLDGNVTRNNICKQTNLSLRTVARVLNSLKSKKVIYRVGSDKDGQWKIVEYKKDDNQKNN